MLSLFNLFNLLVILWLVGTVYVYLILKNRYALEVINPIRHIILIIQSLIWPIGITLELLILSWRKLSVKLSRNL